MSNRIPAAFLFAACITLTACQGDLQTSPPELGAAEGAKDFAAAPGGRPEQSSAGQAKDPGVVHNPFQLSIVEPSMEMGQADQAYRQPVLSAEATAELPDEMPVDAETGHDMAAAPSGLDADEICEGDYVIESADDLGDAAGCVVIEGDLVIQASDLEDLAGLENLQQVGGNLSIVDNDFLDPVQGLPGLAVVEGDITVARNPELADLGLFRAMEQAHGDITIEDNDSMDEVGQLLGETSISGTVAMINLPNLCEEDADATADETNAGGGVRMDGEFAACD